MAAVTSCASLSAGSLRGTLQRGLSSAGNMVPLFQPIAAPLRLASREMKLSTVCLHGRAPEYRRRFISVQVNSQSNEVATASIRSVPVQVARELLNAGHRYLDVRTAEEFAAGHIEGAVNVPYLKSAGGGMTKNLHFVEDITRVFDKDEELVVGCLSGKRSLMASAELQAAEFPNITDMTGGYKAWVDSGLPTVGRS